MTDERLWSLTLAEYQELTRVFEEHRKRELWLHACIQATLYNAHFSCRCKACQRRAEFEGEKHHDPYTPDDFMPEADRKVKPPQPWQEKMQILGAMLQAIKDSYRKKREDQNNGG